MPFNMEPPACASCPLPQQSPHCGLPISPPPTCPSSPATSSSRSPQFWNLILRSSDFGGIIRHNRDTNGQNFRSTMPHFRLSLNLSANLPTRFFSSLLRHHPLGTPDQASQGPSEVRAPGKCKPQRTNTICGRIRAPLFPRLPTLHPAPFCCHFATHERRCLDVVTKQRTFSSTPYP